jgi:hypothetical protein
MKLPEKVLNLLKDQGTVKVLTTVSNEGILHSIVVGSIMPITEKEIVALEIFMGTTSENIKHNKNVAILAVKGIESYLINATAKRHLTEGEFFDAAAKTAKEKGMPVKGLWTFEINTVSDQSASPNAGKKIEN